MIRLHRSSSITLTHLLRSITLNPSPLAIMIIPFWILCLTVMTLVCRTTCHIEADTCREGQLQQANTAYYDNFYGLRLAYRFERTGLGYGALSSEDMSALRVRYFGQAKYSRYASEAILGNNE